jgi:hypothetical protein
MLGHTLKTAQIEAAGGKIEMVIDVNTFEKGVYFVNCLNKSQKLIVE